VIVKILRLKYLLLGAVSLSLATASILAPLTVHAASASLSWAKQTSLGSGTSADSSPLMAKDANGNIYIADSTLQQSGSYHQLGLLKYDPDGNLVWSQSYVETDLHEILMGIAVDGQQNVYVETDSTRFGANYLTLKYSPAGVLLWAQKYSTNSPQNRSQPLGDIRPFAVDAYGNSYVSGQDSSGTVLVKYDTDGNLVWSHTFPDCNSQSYCSRTNVILSGGNVVVTGNAFDSISNSVERLVALKYDTDGNLVWSYVSGNQNNIGFSSSTIDTDGNVYLTGAIGNPSQFSTIKLSSSGGLVWSRLYGAQNIPYMPNDVKVDVQGDVYVTGFYSSNGWVATTVRYNSSGNVVWSANYKLKNQQARGLELSLDGLGNAYVAVQGVDSDHGGTNYDFEVLKYDSSGKQVLEAIYDSGVVDYLNRMYRDDSEGVFLVGTQCQMNGQNCLVEVAKMVAPLKLLQI
jgi:hypothetical protein